MSINKISQLLGDQAAFYLDHKCTTIDKSNLHIPSNDCIEKYGSIPIATTKH